MNWYRFFQAKKPMFLLFNLMSKKRAITNTPKIEYTASKNQ